jgi:hypothetical protein
MSGVRGTISVDVVFTDSTATAGGSSLNTIALRDATEYTSGKVAIVTGTVGTTAVTISGSSLPYRNAAGQFVTFNEYSRIAFQSSRDCTATDGDSPDNRCRSLGNVSLCDWNPIGSSIDIEPKFTAGTASYTLVLYGT